MGMKVGPPDGGDNVTQDQSVKGKSPKEPSKLLERCLEALGRVMPKGLTALMAHFIGRAAQKKGYNYLKISELYYKAIKPEKLENYRKEQLVTACRDGDEKAINTLVDQLISSNDPIHNTILALPSTKGGVRALENILKRVDCKLDEILYAYTRNSKLELAISVIKKMNAEDITKVKAEDLLLMKVQNLLQTRVEESLEMEGKAVLEKKERGTLDTRVTDNLNQKAGPTLEKRKEMGLLIEAEMSPWKMKIGELFREDIEEVSMMNVGAFFTEKEKANLKTGEESLLDKKVGEVLGEVIRNVSEISVENILKKREEPQSLLAEVMSNPELGPVASELIDQCDNLSLEEKSDLLHDAIEGGHGDVIKKVLTGETMTVGTKELELACIKGDVETASHLIEKGVKPTSKALQNALNPLNPNLEIAKQLIKAGADINVQDEETGNTILHTASFFGQRDIIKFLLDHGANRTLRTNHGQTAAEIAREDVKDLFTSSPNQRH